MRCSRITALVKIRRVHWQIFEQKRKAADRLAAYLKCIEETSRGNTEFTKAQKSIEKELRARKMPEMEYFFEHFVPSYKLTLDDLEGF